MEILDDVNVIKQRDPFDALGVAADEWRQLTLDLSVARPPQERIAITQIVVAGMGGSALGAGMLKDWLDLPVCFEVIRGYSLPSYVGTQTLVIADSYSGNTEETLSAAVQARDRGAVMAVVASGGKLLELAEYERLTSVSLPGDFQPRMGVLANAGAILHLLHAYGVVPQEKLDEFAGCADWLGEQSKTWFSSVPAAQNTAKQLAWQAAGKSPVIYASSLFRSVAYKWKISFNENAKNAAWWNEFPEFNHNEFIGWSSHPVDKPYAIIDLRSNFDHPQIQKRFEITDRLLSGQRPRALAVQLEGDSVLKQILWGSVLADFVTIYLAILNQVDPTKVELVEKLKKELV